MMILKQPMWTLIAGIVVGAIVMYAVNRSFTGTQTDLENAAQPLYWVAPMDPNYRRDKPGKSPMGMDLIPVYEQDGSHSDTGAGTVIISPAVENNLGVRTAIVQEGILRPAITTVGIVQYDEDQLIHIHPRVEGWVEKLYVKSSGDPVVAGQKLYALYSPQLVNAQEELVLALNRDNRRLIAAAEDRLRALQMDKPFIDNIRRNRQVQQTVTFSAPKSGVLDNLNIREGFFVKPGLKLMSIGVLDDVWVEAEVFARQANKLVAGLAVTMTLDYFPDRQWLGKVDYVYPSLNKTTRTLRVRLRFDNPDHVLKPNMYAQVTIHQQLAPSLLAPREAVIRTGKQDRVVLALGEGKFKSIAVKLGQSDNEYFEIVQGLNAGENIVTSAQFLLDSESSKSSDVMRMESPVDVQSADAIGVINDIDLNARTINVSRGPIEKWNRPAATMDFLVDDYVPLADFETGDNIHFVFEIRDSDFVITHLHARSATRDPSQPESPATTQPFGDSDGDQQ